MIDIFYFEDSVKKAGIKDIENLKGKPLWIDVTSITLDEAKMLEKAFELHHLTAEDLYKSNVRIKVEEFPHYLFCIFYAINSQNSLGLVELDFVLGSNFLISNHKKEVSSFNELKANKEKLDSLFKKGSDFLFHTLLDYEIDNYFPAMGRIDEQIQAVEEKATKKPRPDLLSDILKLKREIINIKRIAFQQREKVSFLAKNEYKLISKKAVPYFRDAYDHSIRVSDAVDNSREAISSAFDAYMSSVSNKMNEVMKVLSVIATIALPLTVISSIYGTNFSRLPGASYVYGFWVMILLMILVVFLYLDLFL